VSTNLFNVFQGPSAGEKIICSSGLTTNGTRAAIDYFTSPEGVVDLIKRFQSEHRSRLPEYFQAVIRSEIVKGEPPSSWIVWCGPSSRSWRQSNTA
jgi:hypothetical protein